MGIKKPKKKRLDSSKRVSGKKEGKFPTITLTSTASSGRLLRMHRKIFQLTLIEHNKQLCKSVVPFFSVVNKIYKAFLCETF